MRIQKACKTLKKALKRLQLKHYADLREREYFLGVLEKIEKNTIVLPAKSR